TTILPASVTAFQFRLKSFRLMVPVASKPALVCPYGSTAIPLKSTSNVISLVTSLIVISPTIFSPSKDFDSKVSFGNFSALKKSSDFKCVSLSLFFVLIELIFALKRNFEFLKLSSAASIEASKSLKLPVTVEIIMCFTLNSISECAVSTDQFVLFSIFLSFYYLFVLVILLFNNK